MEAQFDDELLQLKNALRQETFRFILIGHNRYSIYQDIANWLRTIFPEQNFLELRLIDKDYRQINNELVAFKKGILLIPDFGWLFQKGNEAICVAFNQRRDAFARLDIALICFIEPNEFIEVPKKVPDWWSLRSLELDFHIEIFETVNNFSDSEFGTSSLGGQTKEEKEAEIQRFLKQIGDTEPSNKELLQKLYSQIGSLWFAISNFEEAEKYFTKRLVLCREVEDYKSEGDTFNSLSRIATVRGDYDLALFYLEQSLAIRQSIDDKYGESQTLNNLSNIYINRGDNETALTYLIQSLEIARQINEQLGEGVILNNIGEIYKEAGDYEKALTYLEQSLEIRRQVNDRSGESATLINLGGLEFDRGNYRFALNYLQESLQISRQTGDKITEGSALNNLGYIYEIQQSYDLAVDHLRQSLLIREQIGDNLGLAITSSNLAQLYFDHFQDVEKAIPLFLKSYAVFQHIGSPNIKTPQSYLNDIFEDIGEERFNQIVQSIRNES